MDFEISLVRADSATWDKVEEAIRRTVEDTGIKANYGEEIGRWGVISLLDYRRHTFKYRGFGKVEVRLLDPPYWAIGKLDRYVHSDVQDLVAVLKTQSSSWTSAVRIWGEALKQSPRSEVLMLFRKHVEHFLRSHGRKIWGGRFDPAEATRLFHRHAGISAPAG